MAIPVVVIGLPTNEIRRAQMRTRLDALAVRHRFFDATDGRLVAPDARERVAPQAALLFDRPLNIGELGCAMSHLAAIAEIAAGPDAFVCVIEDDVIPAADFGRFLEPELLRALPPFDVLRLVSDPERWKFPAWQVAQAHGRGIYAMARPGWGTHGLLYSRDGARKITARLKVLRAPIDHVLFHDCHVAGLRVLEVRPPPIEHDWDAASEIGIRQRPDRSDLTFAGRLRRSIQRRQRKLMVVRSFIAAWGLAGLVRVLWRWPPQAYFR
jgi:glycosyl transferase family 25